MTNGKRHLRLVTMLAMPFLLGGCRGAGEPAASPAASPASAASAAPGEAASEAPLEPAPEATPLPEELGPLFQKPFQGDLDGMIQRRLIRVLTVQDPILYSV